jgi:hypothetical protein
LGHDPPPFLEAIVRRGGRAWSPNAGPASLPAMADEPGDDPESEEDIPREKGGRFARLGEQLTGLLDPESAFRRGSGFVTGVSQATKEELVRIVSGEMRNFLDKMDAADLIQQVIAGLVIDVNMQVRFSREGDGPAQPKITHQEAKIRLHEDERPSRGERKDEPGGAHGESRSGKERSSRGERRDEPGGAHGEPPRSGKK